MGLINEGLQWDGLDIGDLGPSRARGTHQRAIADSTPDFFRQLLPVGNGLRVLCLGWVSEESAFHQHGWDAAFAQHVIASPAHAPVWRRCTSRNVVMDRGSKRQTFRTVKVGFDAVCAAARRSIEMYANENGVPV